MRRWIFVLAFAACGGSHAKTAEPVAKPAGKVAGKATCAKPMTEAELCKCIMAENEAEEGITGECNNVDDGKVPGLHVVRVGNGQQTDTFLTAQVPGGWIEVTELYYEQQHGHRQSDLSKPVFSEQTIRGQRVVRLDYHTVSDIVAVQDNTEQNDEKDEVMVCVLGKEVHCESAVASCHSKVDPMPADEGTPPSPPSSEESSQAKVELGADGTLTVTKVSESPGVRVCAVKPQSLPLVP
jgi:hypothetical protein